jgi:uncharacterized protein YecE (DUF72 family)
MTLTPEHGPPPLASLRRAPEPARIGAIRIGTASWTDRTLLESGTFYPPTARSAEQRLRFYAHHFSMVEVDASYYAVPAPRTAEAWVDRTPDDFLFGIKAYAALTGHPFEPMRLDRDLSAELPAGIRRKPRLYPRDLPAEVLDAIWERFLATATILQRAGKLAYVLFQLPPWFRVSAASVAYLEDVARRAHGFPCAVEFREPRWMSERFRDRTLGLLRRHGLAYVSVDEPQGTAASVPPVAAVTCEERAVVRFHGRRRETWAARGVGVSERFRYLYSGEELAEWCPRIHALARQTRDVHVVMNNCYREHAVQNAKDIAGLLASTQAG